VIRSAEAIGHQPARGTCDERISGDDSGFIRVQQALASELKKPVRAAVDEHRAGHGQHRHR
jgi:hypothetical protein